MSNNKVKVVGYAKAVKFGNGIEYTNFTPDLVGFQLASNGGTPLFTMGSFAITTNMEPKVDKKFITNKFSNFVTLTDLDLTLEETIVLLTNNAGVLLNLDKTNLSNYALFGSLSELVRVSLEDIIINWPASLYMTPLIQSSTDVNTLSGNTVLDYEYNSLTDSATFTVPTNFISNKFQINYQENGTIVNTFNETNNIRNLVPNYSSYSVLYNGMEYAVLGLTGSTNLLDDYLYISVSGNPFSGLGSDSATYYHIKPNKLIEEQFFNSLPDLEAYLLNRLVIPQYTATFKYPIKSETGVLLYTSRSLTWPVTDGYNIDFDTIDYTNYVTALLEISQTFDLYTSNLMNRFLVTESITDFDTSPVYFSTADQDSTGQKMNKTLNIYGREFDEINNFINGIAFAHTVSYDKQDNIPDIYLKNLAKVFGWGLVSSVLENDLLSSYVSSSQSTYSGQSVGLTPVEADVELWRRIILNTPWLWKSKGTRKAIEFLFKFIGAPNGLFKFNQYVYLANAPIDVDLFQQALALNGLSTDLSLYPIDEDGYPSPLENTPDLYFQSDGLWYRETGGSGSTIDILTGNNPHLGPYDGGFRYINQFRTLIPNFSAVTISSTTVTSGSTNLFSNYNSGSFNGYNGNTYVDATDSNGFDLDNCFVVDSSIITTPKVNLNGVSTSQASLCGCNDTDTTSNTLSGTSDDALSICVGINQQSQQSDAELCQQNIQSFAGSPDNDGTLVFRYYEYNMDGSIYSVGGVPVTNTSEFVTQTCCGVNGGKLVPLVTTPNYNPSGGPNAGPKLISKYSIMVDPYPFSIEFSLDNSSSTWTDTITIFLTPTNNGTVFPDFTIITFPILNGNPDGSTTQLTTGYVNAQIATQTLPAGFTFECVEIESHRKIKFKLATDNTLYAYTTINVSSSENNVSYNNTYYWVKSAVTPILENTGYICYSGVTCPSAVVNFNWMPYSFDSNPAPNVTNNYIKFRSPDWVPDFNGVPSFAWQKVTADGTNCIGDGYTVAVPNVQDDWKLNTYGFACSLTQKGLDDLNAGLESVKNIGGTLSHMTFPSNSVIWNTYYLRSIGAIPFNAIFDGTFDGSLIT